MDDLILHIIGENSEQVMDELISKMKQDYKLTISPNINQFLGLNLINMGRRASMGKDKHGEQNR